MNTSRRIRDCRPSFSWRSCAGSALLTWLALGGVSRAQEELITMNVQEEDIRQVLHALSIQYRINLVAGDEVQGKVTLNLYEVPLDEALKQILSIRGLGFVREGGFYRVLPLEELQRISELADVFESRVFRLNHISAEEAQLLIKPLLSEKGTVASGKPTPASLESNEGGSSSDAYLVVRDRRSHLTAIEKTLEKVDHPPLQVLLEATIVGIDLGEENKFGIDFNFLGGVDFQDLSASSNLSGLSGLTASGDDLAHTIFSGQTSGFVQSPVTSGLSIGIIGTRAAAFLEALEETTSATILANPKVLALNRRKAEIIVGGRLGYVTTTTTETSTLEEVQFLDTGTKLIFRPFVGEDGWIRLEVHPQNSSGVIDPVSGVPSESTSEITTSVLVKDGSSIAIGGLISERTAFITRQVPLLGSVPYIGALFRRKEQSLARRELIILLTPHIVDAGAEDRKAREILSRWEAVRRSHLDVLSDYLRPMWARDAYLDAVVLRRKGRLDEALGAIERAISADPTHVGAAVLRLELLRELALEQEPNGEELQSLFALELWGERGGKLPHPPSSPGSPENSGAPAAPKEHREKNEDGGH